MLNIQLRLDFFTHFYFPYVAVLWASCFIHLDDIHHLKFSCLRIWYLGKLSCLCLFYSYGGRCSLPETFHHTLTKKSKLDISEK